MTTINFGNEAVKGTRQHIVFSDEPQPNDLDVDATTALLQNPHHLFTEICFVLKSPHHSLSFLHLLNEKIRNTVECQRSLRKIDYEISIKMTNEDECKVMLRVRKTIPTMNGLHSFFKKCDISTEWLLSHCTSYDLHIPSTNKKYENLSQRNQPYLDGFIIPNVPNVQTIDWLPAVLQSDDVMYTSGYRGPSKKVVEMVEGNDGQILCKVDDEDDEDDEESNDGRIEFPGGIRVPMSLHTKLHTSPNPSNKDDVDNDKGALTEEDIDAITSSSSFAFSLCTTAPSKFVMHGNTCRCEFDNGTNEEIDETLTEVLKGADVTVPRCFAPCRRLIAEDPFRPEIESKLIEASSSSWSTGLCPISSSWLKRGRRIFDISDWDDEDSDDDNDEDEIMNDEDDDDAADEGIDMKILPVLLNVVLHLLLFL